MRSRAIALIQEAEDVGRRLCLEPHSVAETEIGHAVQSIASAYQLARKQLPRDKARSMDRAWPKDGPSALGRVTNLRDAIHHDALDPISTVRLYPGMVLGQSGQIRVEPGGKLKVEGWFELGSAVDAFEIGSDGIFRIENPGERDETRHRISPVTSFVFDNRLEVGGLLVEAADELRSIWHEVDTGG